MRDEYVDEQLSADLQRALNADLATLDPNMRRRLQAARGRALQAMEKSSRHQPWPWLTASAIVASVMLVAGVVVHSIVSPTASSLAQFETNATADDLAVSEDLDFYQWLSARESSG